MDIYDEPLDKFAPHCSICGRNIQLSEDVYEQEGELLCEECFEQSYTIKSALDIALDNRDSAYEQSVNCDE